MTLEHQLAMIAAQEWARSNSTDVRDPVAFGGKVALAYCACLKTQYHMGDNAATAEALAALSTPVEALQLLGQVASLVARSGFHPAGQTTEAGSL